MKDLKIAFFDSGMGGLTVLKTAIKMYPYEKYIYYADTANAPYGNLSKDKIYKYTYNCISKLIQTGIKALVLACNTATNAGIVKLREGLNIEIIGMEPAIKPASEKIKEGKILVLATEATLKQDKFKELYAKYNRDNIVLSPQKNLAIDIEENFFNKDILREKLDKCLKRYKNCGFSGIVLGCTHYVLIKDLIREQFKNAEIFDGNSGTVINLFKKLREKNLISADKELSVEIFTSCGLETKKQQYLNILKSF